MAESDGTSYVIGYGIESLRSTPSDLQGAQKLGDTGISPQPSVLEAATDMINAISIPPPSVCSQRGRYVGKN